MSTANKDTPAAPSAARSNFPPPPSSARSPMGTRLPGSSLPAAPPHPLPAAGTNALPDLLGADVAHVLSLKVVRQPPSQPLPTPPSSLARRNSVAGTQPVSSSAGLPQGRPAAPGTGTSEGVDVLSLPGALCNVYLGESFAGKFVIVNEGPSAGLPIPVPAAVLQQQPATAAQGAVATRVCIKAEFKVNNNSYHLADNSSRPVPSLAPGQAAEVPFHHEFKEIGTNILVCTVTYMFDGERHAAFERSAKFVTTSPVGVKTKFHNFTQGKVFLEIQLSNTSGAALSIRRMNFYPTDPFQYRDLNFVVAETDSSRRTDQKEQEMAEKLGFVQGVSRLTLEGGEESAEALGGSSGGVGEQTPHARGTAPAREQYDPLFDGLVTNRSVFPNEYTSPGDLRQYLYLLAPKNPSDMTAWLTTVVGKLDIVWRTSGGEHGRLQTAPLSRKPPALEELEISVVRVPESVYVERPFSVKCRAHNRTPSAVNLVVSAVKQKMGSIVLSGFSSLQLDKVAPNSTVDFALDFFPLLPGLQAIDGLKVTDLISGQSKEIPSFTDVFVLRGGEAAVRP